MALPRAAERSSAAPCDPPIASAASAAAQCPFSLASPPSPRACGFGSSARSARLKSARLLPWSMRWRSSSRPATSSGGKSGTRLGTSSASESAASTLCRSACHDPKYGKIAYVRHDSHAGE
eukprot:6197703-Pleurochrysis_carterae.AAC.1